MKQVPEFVVRNGASANDWLPETDKYFGSDFGDVRNQETWWLNNHRIRQAFAQIDSQVEEIILKGKVPSMHILSYASLAKLSLITRASLYHGKRINWVRAQRKTIRKKILLAAKNSQAFVQNRKLKKQNSELKKKLFNRREETVQRELSKGLMLL